MRAGELALLGVEEMGRADRYAIEHGVAGIDLMERAGAAVAREVAAQWSPRPTVVLCGPGNNGGDGFVAARLLAAQGWPIRLALLGEAARLKGDARVNAERWNGPVEAASPAILDGASLVVDALFGAGLARPLDGVALEIVKAILARGLPCVGIDMPSGVHGDSGEILGAAADCALTVTFFRRKPGHLLLPGRLKCGRTVVAGIGIPDAALDPIAPATFLNAPGLWRDHWRWPRLDDHKYRRGHAVVAGGAEMTGAARLAARAALRAGAGMVSLACPDAAFPIYAAALTAGIIVHPLRGRDAFASFLDDPRKNAVLLGPGNGVSLLTRTRVKQALATGKPCVLDADALTVFADAPAELFDAIRGPVVLTPHDGEYARLFPHGGDRLSRARAAARDSGAVVGLKGADTVVAAPDGRAAITGNAPPVLATAGAGDVLAGLTVGLLASGMPAFEAAAAAVWLHGEAGTAVGPGLIADDLPEQMPALLRRLRDGR